MIWTLLAIVRGSMPLQIILAAVIGLAGLKAWQLRERSIGARVAIEKVEKANDTAIAIGKSGADKSGASGVRGQRDPTARDD